MSQFSKKLKVKRLIAFKHGVSYFILEGTQIGSGTFELEFKIDEMNDILKSLFVRDTSGKGFISSISYDAALDTSQLLKSIMLDIPDQDSFSSLITQIKGAKVKVRIGTSEEISGTIMGIEFIEKLDKSLKITEKVLTLLNNDDIIIKIAFSEISSLEIVNEDLKRDLKFYLDTVIAGKKKDAKKIIINAESGGYEGERKILVSYIRESPIWKTSYRIITSKEQILENKCLISGWALIENTTNQDWEDIELSLVAGMPVSFIYDFYKPIFMERTKILPPRVLSARPVEIEEGLEVDEFKAYKKEAAEAYATPKAAMMPMKPQAVAAVPPPAPGGGSGLMAGLRGEMFGELDKLKAIMKAQTAVQSKDMGELFEYNIANPVSIKRKQSALVPILTEEMKAKKILLYNKIEHDKNPNACLEITNNTGLMLERGPATIIYENNLAGEAIIPFLNKDDTRILNYAVEQAVIITNEEKTQHQNIHRVSIASAYCYEYYFTDLKTNYKINNKTDEIKELYLDHPKKSGYEIKESPIEPEETPNYWRFKLKLKAKEAVSFDIRERCENYTSYYIYNYTKDDLLKRVEFYIRQSFINEILEEQLNNIGELIGNKSELTEKKSQLETEKYNMEQEQVRLRENISVLGNTSQENVLREKYIKKLTAQEERFENISKEIKNLEEKIKVLDKEINEKIYKIQLK